MIKKSDYTLLLDLEDEVERVDTEDEVDRDSNVDDQSEGLENSECSRRSNLDDEDEECSCCLDTSLNDPGKHEAGLVGSDSKHQQN